MTESAAGESIAPPRPWIARPTISCVSEVARPLASEAREKTATPAMNRERLPSRSAARPPSSRKPPKNSV